MSVGAPLCMNVPPTLTQVVALAHVTPLKNAPVAPVGRAAVTTDHVVPFHCSINGFADDDAGNDPS